MSRPSLKFYCFSPAVMAATFVIETAGAFWVLIRYRFDITAKLIVALLLCLGLFQLAEYMVCEGAFGISSLDWARIGYVAITALPPLGLHLGMTIAGRRNGWLLAFAYGSGLAFALFFLFTGQGMQSHICLGNYVIFKIAPYAVKLYAMYYYGWLLAGLAAMSGWREKMKRSDRRAALGWLMVGYTAFIVPTTLINIANPETIAGIPSIMCGFAVLLALVLIFRVAPLTLKQRSWGRRA